MFFLFLARSRAGVLLDRHVQVSSVCLHAAANASKSCAVAPQEATSGGIVGGPALMLPVVIAVQPTRAAASP